MKSSSVNFLLNPPQPPLASTGQPTTTGRFFFLSNLEETI